MSSRRLIRATFVTAITTIPMLTGCVACPPSMTNFERGAGELASTQVGNIAEIIAKERPDAFVGSAISDVGGDPATLYIKGPRDGCIDQLVSSASVSIVVAYDQPFSFAELEARQRRVHESLLVVTDNVGIGFDITRRGMMVVTVTGSDRVPDADAVMELIPPDLRDSVEVQLVADDVGDGG